MLVSLVLTLVGPDRPGLVEAVATSVASCGGNWLESRMARLGGQFAGIARVEIPAAREAELRQAIAQSERETRLSIVVARDAATVSPTAPGQPATLELLGQDRPGIVREISRVLAARGVNVEELVTECGEAPEAGGMLFRARAEVILPPGVSLGAVRGELEKLAADLMVDLSLRELR